MLGSEELPRLAISWFASQSSLDCASVPTGRPHLQLSLYQIKYVLIFLPLFAASLPLQAPPKLKNKILIMSVLGSHEKVTAHLIAFQ